MSLRLTLGYWGSSTLEIGLAVDDDGRATGWRTGGRRVGRFARELTATERRALTDALGATRSDGDGPGPQTADDAPTPPSGVSEQLVGDDLFVTFDPHEGPPAAVEPLLAVLKAIRDDLADSAVAAIELDVSGSPLRARLRHVGTEPIRVRSAGPIRVDVTAYGKNSTLVDSRSETIETAGLPDAVDTGWELVLLDHIGLTAPSRGGFLAVRVGPLDVDSVGDGVLGRADFSWESE